MLRLSRSLLEIKTRQDEHVAHIVDPIDIEIEQKNAEAPAPARPFDDDIFRIFSLKRAEMTEGKRDRVGGKVAMRIGCRSSMTDHRFRHRCYISHRVAYVLLAQIQCLFISLSFLIILSISLGAIAKG